MHWCRWQWFSTLNSDFVSVAGLKDQGKCLEGMSELQLCLFSTRGLFVLDTNLLKKSESQVKCWAFVSTRTFLLFFFFFLLITFFMPSSSSPSSSFSYSSSSSASLLHIDFVVALQESADLSCEVLVLQDFKRWEWLMSNLWYPLKMCVWMCVHVCVFVCGCEGWLLRTSYS